MQNSQIKFTRTNRQLIPTFVIILSLLFLGLNLAPVVKAATCFCECDPPRPEFGYAGQCWAQNCENCDPPPGVPPYCTGWYEVNSCGGGGGGPPTYTSHGTKVRFLTFPSLDVISWPVASTTTNAAPAAATSWVEEAVTTGDKACKIPNASIAQSGIKVGIWAERWREGLFQEWDTSPEYPSCNNDFNIGTSQVVGEVEREGGDHVPTWYPYLTRIRLPQASPYRQFGIKILDTGQRPATVTKYQWTADKVYIVDSKFDCNLEHSYITDNLGLDYFKGTPNIYAAGCPGNGETALRYHESPTRAAWAARVHSQDGGWENAPCPTGFTPMVATALGEIETCKQVVTSTPDWKPETTDFEAISLDPSQHDADWEHARGTQTVKVQQEFDFTVDKTGNYYFVPCGSCTATMNVSGLYSSGGQLLKNESFESETGEAHWDFGPINHTVVNNSTIAHDGTHLLRVNQPCDTCTADLGAGNYSFVQDTPESVTLVAGDALEFSIWGNSPSGTPLSGRLVLTDRTHSNALLNTTSFILTSSEWQQLTTGTVTNLPVGTITVRARVVLDTPGNINYRFDDAKLRLFHSTWDGWRDHNYLAGTTYHAIFDCTSGECYYGLPAAPRANLAVTTDRETKLWVGLVDKEPQTGNVTGRVVDATGVTACPANSADLVAKPRIPASTGSLIPAPTGGTGGPGNPFTYTGIPTGSYSVSATNPGGGFSSPLYCKYSQTGQSILNNLTNNPTFTLAGNDDTVTAIVGYTKTQDPWWQSKDGDILAQIIGNPIPVTCIAPTCSPYVSLAGSGGFPGVIAYQTPSANYDDGTGGSPSEIGWLVEEPLGQAQTGLSYQSLAGKISQWIDVAGVVNGGQIRGNDLVTKATNQPTSFLKYDGGDLTITTSDIAAVNKKLVLFVSHGNLTIKRKVNFTPGVGFVGFIVNGNITIDSGVGGGSEASPDLEGIYFADGTIFTGTKQTTADSRLVVRGSLVGLSGITLQRDLDPTGANGANNTTPAEIIIFAPDLYFTFPQELRDKTFLWEQIPS